MWKLRKIICALAILACPALAQNEIDHISTLYPSGYGKMAIDGDTLYVNILNGLGVERYDIADPTNPVFIDREEVSGFDQIDFERRLMAKTNLIGIELIDISDFNNAGVLSAIPITLSWTQNFEWKLIGDYLVAVSSDDTIRTYNISNPMEPYLISLFGTICHGESYGHDSVIGSTVCVILDHDLMGYGDFRDIYNISRPDSIYLIHSDTLYRSPAGGYGIMPVRGDTIANAYLGSAGYSWSIHFVSYALGDTSHLPSWGESMNGRPPGYYSNDNSFLLAYFYTGVIAHSIANFVTLGKAPDPFSYGGEQYTFDCTLEYNFITATHDSLYIFQPTYSDSILMPLLSSVSQPHMRILSSVSYGNYILSGAESNGGELLIHYLDQSNQLNLVSVVPNVKAQKIIIEGSSAICLCPYKISQVDLSNPTDPVVSHELNGFSGELRDFAAYDSLIFAITDRVYYVIDYDSSAGMTVLSQMDFPAGSLTSMAQSYTASILLQGNLAHLVKISALNPTFPIIVQEKQLRPDTFTNVEIIYFHIWASGKRGTDVFWIYTMDSTAFFGPEYFSDVRQMSFIIERPDTLFVADGINGIKMFTFPDYPYTELHYIGGYSTGNVVNQVAAIGDNFFISDYYSLQHLRWGAPTGIGGSIAPRIPERFTLLQNYPNPFNSSTIIRYSLPQNEKATLSIFDITGRQVRQLVISGERHEIIWDSLNASGKPVASGLYFYAVEGHTDSVRKMVLLR